jgi:anti-sigma-K factor RskA
LTCNHCTSEEYAFFAIGTLEGPDRDLIRSHVRSGCQDCIGEIRDALAFWCLLAALTERTQLMENRAPSRKLRERVIAIAAPPRVHVLRRISVRTWMQIAAGVLIAASASTLSWRIGKVYSQRDIAAIQSRVDQQAAGMKKLQSENNSLRNLVVAARNAPVIFPGRDSIVSVQDPYMLRDLQRARTTQAAAAQALNEERKKAAELEKRLSQTTALLAAATRDREEADQKYRKAFEAATMEKEHGSNTLSAEIRTYNTKVQDLESQIAHYRTVIDSQSKKLEQHSQMIWLPQSKDLTLIQLHGDQNASAVALIAGESRLVLFPSNFAVPPAGRTYQLWLIHDKGTVTSVGTFNGAASLQFSSPALKGGVKSLAVTEEPAGGSAMPTGRKIITGTNTKG